MTELKRLPAAERAVSILPLRRYDAASDRDAVVEGWQSDIIKALQARHLWPDVIHHPEVLIDCVRAEFQHGDDSQTWLVLPDGRTLKY